MCSGDKVSTISLGSQYANQVKEHIRTWGAVKPALANNMLDYILELEARLNSVNQGGPKRFAYVTKGYSY